VEVYFPGYGWIEFEPTAARQIPNRSTESTLPEISEPLPALGRSVATRPNNWQQGWWLLLPGGLVLLVIGGVTWSVADGWRLHRLAPAAAVATLYERLQRHGQRLAFPIWTGDTPYESATSLVERVNMLAQERRWKTVLAPAEQEIHWLTTLYVRTFYSTHQPDPVDQAQAIHIWQRLRRRLWLAWVSTFWTRGRR
jgi:hypothetical protein